MTIAFNATKPRRLVRLAILASWDAMAAVISLIAATLLRMNGEVPPHMREGIEQAALAYALTSALVLYVIGGYHRVWRYVSLPDLFFVVRAATLAIGASLVMLLALDRIAWMPISVPIIQWFIMVMLLAAGRIGWRLYCIYNHNRTMGAQPRPASSSRRALLAGSGSQVEIILRFLQANRRAGYQAVGIVDDDVGHVRLKIRGVPILGSVDTIEDVVQGLAAAGRRPDCVIIAGNSDHLSGAALVRLVTRAEALGLSVARLSNPAAPAMTSLGELDLRFIDMADLLGRPQAQLDTSVLTRAIAGRAVMVTGAGGTIGRELVRQIALLNPDKLILLDAGEFNLYTVDQELQEVHPNLPRATELCSVRQRAAVMKIFDIHRPELVFHAAALKHVPLVERNPSAGVQTNVIGTRNVADAARRFKVKAMIQVSTDKAVNPIGIMGTTKRLGELYCQALDLDDRENEARFLTVRFGNVLGSSGSLIPLLQRQLSHRGPLTITHPEIERYFMTVQEAVQLILHGTACALQGGDRRGRIFVLDMGKPIKVVDVAHRLIRLAGLVPNIDVPIDFVGLRPGEKLYEELFDEDERPLPSPIAGILQAEPNPVPLSLLNRAFDRLHEASLRDDAPEVRRLLAETLALSRDRAAKMPSKPAFARDMAATNPILAAE